MGMRLGCLLLSIALLAGCGRGGEQQLSATDIRGVMPDLRFAMTRVNDGAAVTADNYRGRPVILYFGYTHCPDICDKVNSNLDSLVKGYAKNKMLRFVSITIDPTNENPVALKKYSRRFQDAAKWQFLTGDRTAISNLATNGFFLNAGKEPNGQFNLDDKLVLIDQEKRIRGYYHGTSIPDMNRLNDEIKVLIAEELRKIKAPEM